MKSKLFLILTAFLFVATTSVQAQFYQNGSSVVYTYDRVGIGTPSPDARLEIANNSTAGRPSLQVTETGTDLGRMYFRNTTNPSRYAFIGSNPGSSNPILSMGYSNGSTSTHQFSIDLDAGHVGINTGNANWTLDVNHKDNFFQNNGFRLANTGNQKRDWKFYTSNPTGRLYLFSNIDNNNPKVIIDDNTGNYIIGSDKRFKENIEYVDDNSELDKLLALKPATYTLKTETDKSARKAYGLIAQEVQEIIPSIVVEGLSKAEGGEGYLAVSYTELIPIIIASMQAQQEVMEEKNTLLQGLEEEVDELTTRIDRLEKLLTTNLPTNNATQTAPVSPLTKVAFLEQSTPNPTGGWTNIAYFVPENASQAFLQITDLNGQVIQKIPLNSKGYGQVEFDTANLTSGTYLNSLMVNGQLVQANKMIVR